MENDLAIGICTHKDEGNKANWGILKYAGNFLHIVLQFRQARIKHVLTVLISLKSDLNPQERASSGKIQIIQDPVFLKAFKSILLGINLTSVEETTKIVQCTF